MSPADTLTIASSDWLALFVGLAAGLGLGLMVVGALVVVGAALTALFTPAEPTAKPAEEGSEYPSKPVTPVPS
ncbi:MAG: hypothetical protein IT305_04455 [Chloroflexi bacterium]|nr:hypothetical protein [Chloroflexota bacterium]